MTKKQLRQRVKDICAGASLVWMEDDKCFDGMCAENLGKAMMAVRHTLNLEQKDVWIFNTSGVQYWDNLDSVVDKIYYAGGWGAGSQKN